MIVLWQNSDNDNDTVEVFCYGGYDHVGAKKCEYRNNHDRNEFLPEAR